MDTDPFDVVVECAFDNDLDESIYAPTGWTEITSFVNSASGTLRGRSYELDQIQTGTLAFELDNADGRFTPGNPTSPYYPNLKSRRAIRMRGKNMQTLNTARTGAQTHDAFDFFPNAYTTTRYSATTAPSRVEAEDYTTSSGDMVVATTRDPQGGGSEMTYIKTASWLAYSLDFDDTPPDSLSLRVVSQDGCTISVRTGTSTGTVIGTVTIPASHNWTTYRTVAVDVSAANLKGAQTIVVTFTGPKTYMCNVNWLSFKLRAQQISAPTAVQHDSAALGFTDALADPTEGWHIEATIDNAQPAGDFRVISWYNPIELGVRLTHSAYLWLVSGTEPTANPLPRVGLEIHYYDADHNLISTAGEARTVPLPNTPTRLAFSSLPPSNAKYAIGAVVMHTTVSLTEDLTYAVAGIQTELPANLAPNISGGPDCAGWSSNGGLFNQAGVANQGTYYLARLTDTFADLSKWTPGGSPTVSGGKLVFATGTAGAYSQVTSRIRDMRGSGFSVKVESDASLGAQTEFWATAQVDANNSASFIVSGAAWICRVRVGGVNTDAFMPPGHPSIPAWLCIREANGVVYWDTSTDGVTWTTIYSATHAVNFTKTAINFQGGAYAANTANHLYVSELNTHNPEPGVTVTWQPNGTEISQQIPRLIPGETYTVTAEVRKAATNPDVTLTMTDGFDGATLTVDNTWTTLTTTWVARRSTDTLKLICASDPFDAITVTVRKINVRKGSSASLAGAWDTDVTDWQRPKEHFYGWVDQWPVTLTDASTAPVSITAVDRLTMLARTDLQSVQVEELYRDNAALILPLTDSPSNGGYISDLGTWADASGISSFKITATRGDITGASYDLSVDGLRDSETALKLTEASPTLGYLISLPWSQDYKYAVPKPLPTSPPGTTPGTSEPLFRQYFSTWHGSYSGSGNSRNTEYSYQGNNGDAFGDQRSLWGWNWQAIKADLVGVELIGVTLTLRNLSWHGKSGTALLGTHTFNSRPSGWSATDTKPRLWRVEDWTENEWRTIPLPLSFAQGMVAGTVRGISLGPAASTDKTYYGVFGSTLSGQKPVLSFIFRRTQ